MLPFRIRGMILVHNLLLSCAATAVFWALIFAHFSVLRLEQIEWLRYSAYWLMVVAALCVDAVNSKLRGTDLLQLDLRGALKLSLRQTATTLVLLLLFLVAFKDQGMSRLFLFSFVPLLYAVLLVLNVSLPRALARLLFFNKRRERTLLIGSTREAERLVEWCRGKALYGLDVIGVITDDIVPALQDHPVLGRIADLEEALVNHSATQVIALTTSDPLQMKRIGELSGKHGVRLLLVSEMTQEVEGGGSSRQGQIQIVSLREEPLECPFNRIVKKALDVTLSIPVVLFVLPPISLIVHLIHRHQSPGPLFFRQPRTGINYKTFYIYKFRTMHVNHGSETQQAAANDVRVFTLGRWLRKLSIDELPQFINVLHGHMSIVGPRPHMLEHTAQFAKMASDFHLRTLVKPGITGLAQVRGFRGETATRADVLRRVESDVYYLEHWSLLLESLIILKTVFHMVRPPKSAF